MSIYRFIVCVVLLACSQAGTLRADNTGHPGADTSTVIPGTLNERIEVVTDRHIYAVGEKILFAGFLLSPPALDTACRSKVLYLELLTPGGNSVAQGKFPLQCSSASGYIKIPESSLTGHYYLAAYTKWMRNFSPMGFHYQLVKVINPHTAQLESSNLSMGNGQGEAWTPKALDESIACSTDKALYRQRDKVGLTIHLPLLKRPVADTYTLSVTRKGSADSLGQFNILPETVQYHGQNGHIYLPEAGGLSLSGRIVHKDGAGPVTGGLVNLAILGQQPEYRVIRSGSTGSFCFALDSLHGSKDMYITTDQGKETPEIRIDNDFANPAVTFPELPFILSDSEKRLAGEILFSSQIHQHFPSPDPGTAEAGKPASAPVVAFYGIPSNSILIDDYIELPSLKEVLIELVPGVFPRMRNKAPYLTFSGNKLTYSLINQYRPLLLVDHVPVLDLEKLLLMSPKKIYSVELLNEIYILGNTTYGGILNIITRKGDLAGIDLPENSFFFDFNFFLPQDEGAFPKYEDRSFDPENPDYRNCLYWSPDIRAQPGQVMELEFFTSDNSGEYRVLVRGIGEDGSILQGKCDFRVE